MFIRILNLLILAQQPQDVDPIETLKNLWPILLFIVLSALSGFIKRKQDKSKTPSPKTKIPATTPPPIQARRLPFHPRQATQAGQPQPTPTRPASPGKTPALTPRPVVQKPPLPTRLPYQPAPQKPYPASAISPLATRKFAPAPRPISAKVRPPKIKSRPPIPAPLRKLTPAQIAAQKPMITVPQAAQLRKTAPRSEEPTGYRTFDSPDPLKITFERQDVLIRAILYAEILDKPMALRSAGSHDFSPIPPQ